MAKKTDSLPIVIPSRLPPLIKYEKLKSEKHETYPCNYVELRRQFRTN